MELFLRAVFLFAQSFLVLFVGFGDSQLVLNSRPHNRHNRRLHPTKWQEWSQWGPCSRTCGEGVSKRTRVCLVWDGHGYRQTYVTMCSGSDVSYRICNMPDCPSGTPEYRHWQCASAGDRLALTSDVSHVKWFPARGGRPCDLRCQSSLGWTHSLGSALDGTRCYSNPRNTHVCINGSCQRVGCDGIVGSRTRYDVCGKCSKSGIRTTCFLTAARYYQPVADNSTDVEGYNFIITVPKGTTYLHVQENATNLIALRDDKGRFIINGPNTESRNGVYTVAGTDFRYSRSPLGPESLETTGPLLRDATILLALKQRNPGVYYHFWQPFDRPATLPFGSTYIYPPPDTAPPDIFPDPPKFQPFTISYLEIPRPTTKPPTTTTTTKPRTYTPVPTSTTTPPPATTKTAVLERPVLSDDDVWSLVMERLAVDSELRGPPDGERSGTAASNRPGGPDISAGTSDINRSGSLGGGGRRRPGSEGDGLSVGGGFPTSGRGPEDRGRDRFDLSGRSEQDGFSLGGGRPDKATSAPMGGDDLSGTPNENGNGSADPGHVDRQGGPHLNGTHSRGRHRIETTTANPLNVTEIPQCEDCRKMKDRLFHFCDSDFVTEMMINGKRYVGGETRYDVTIMKSYKARMKLLSREYLWAPNLCNCPRLRVRRSYIIMGFMQRHMDRELKLIVTPTAYVRRYSQKQHERMLKLQDFVKC